MKWRLIWAMFARKSECTGCTAIPRELTCVRVRMRACVEFLHIRGTSGTSLSYLSVFHYEVKGNPPPRPYRFLH